MASIKQFGDPLTRRKKSQPVPTVQRKLKVGNPNDKSEQEADNVADRVMRMPTNEEQESVNMQPQEEEEKVSKISKQAEAEEEDSSMIKMQPDEEEKNAVSMKPEEEEASLQKQEDEELQKQADDEEIINKQPVEEEESSISEASEDKEEVNLKSTTTPAKVKHAPSKVVNQINSSQSGGQALPQKANAELSQKMGKDFSNVKIHTDSQAAQMNKDLSAKAFTHKNHIYFNQGQFSPASRGGRKLLAHELTHVIQQTGKGDGIIQREWIKDKYRYDSEKEAVRRRKALQRKHGKADCYPVGSQWQCRYWVVPKKQGKAAKPVAKPAKAASKWIIDKGKYYKDKPGAETRATALGKTYGKVEVFQRKDNNWQCRYQNVKPIKAAKATKAPASLLKFKADINIFKVKGLNAVLLTVFGEISGNLHPKLANEAKAVTSTIFNRYSLIIQTRIDYKKLLAIKKNKTLAYQKSIAVLENLTKNPSKYKKELGEAGYAKAVKEAKKAYKLAISKQSAATTTLQKASNEKIAVESYMKKKYRGLSAITLTMIVDDKGQYEGYPKGKKDYANYSKMNKPDQIRNAKRWDTAKKAVELIANNTKLVDVYVQFRSNFKGTRKMNPGDVRIGGNDFWK